MNSKLLTTISALILTITGFAPLTQADVTGIPSRLIVLNPTTNAPAGATGFAVVSPVLLLTPTIASAITSNNVPSLSVDVAGLVPGTYTVTITDADTNSYTLGTFDVTTLPNIYMLPIWPPPITTGGQGTFPLPDGVGPFGVADVLVSDANGLVDLAGNFNAPPPPPPPTNHIFETAVLQPTTNAPVIATGLAVLSNGIYPVPLTAASIIWPVTNAPTVYVGVEGLLPGSYTVTITDSATNDYVLGTVDVITYSNIVISTNSAGLRPITTTAGRAQFGLPDGLDPVTIVSIDVADGDGVIDLAGKFTPPVPPPPPREIRDVTILRTTTNAPPNAMGRAALEIEHDNGTNTPTLEVETIGLLVGTYTVDITDTATNDYTLGTFDVQVRTNSAAGNLGSPTAVVFWSNTVGRAELALPDGLDPASVVSISVSDADALVDMTGDFRNRPTPFPCHFNTHAVLEPGSDYANLQGVAQLQINVAKGKTKGKFSLIAYDAPANTAVSLFINDEQVGTTKINSRGRILIKRLPKSIDPRTVQTIQGQDSNGNVLFTATF